MEKINMARVLLIVGIIYTSIAFTWVYKNISHDPKVQLLSLPICLYFPALLCYVLVLSFKKTKGDE